MFFYATFKIFLTELLLIQDFALKLSFSRYNVPVKKSYSVENDPLAIYQYIHLFCGRFVGRKSPNIFFPLQKSGHFITSNHKRLVNQNQETSI